MPKIKLISTDLDLIAKLICFNARSIQLGLYAQNGYLVLPYPMPSQPQTVYFPDFSYTKNFWYQLQKLHDYSLAAKYPDQAIAEVKPCLHKYDFPDASKLISEWGNQSPKFLAMLPTYFSPDFLSKVKDITILLTEFGTLGSFSKKTHPDGTFSLVCSSRIDFPISNTFNIIIQGLILCLQSGYNDLGTIGWHQRQALVTYLTTQTQLGQFISSPTPPPLDQNIYQKSSANLSRLGYPAKISLTPSKLANLLTPHELRLFTCLYFNQNTLVNFDDAGTAVWQEQVDEKYSLYALAKLVENLRRKIRSSGTNSDHLRTFRKRGYMLTV